MKKQMTITIVILSILLVGSIGYICYDKFLVKDTKNEVKTEEKETAKKNISKNEEDTSITVEDRYAFGLETINNEPSYIVYILDGGNLYYKYVPVTSFAAAAGLYDFESTPGTDKNLTLLEGLPKIKRIKGVNTISDAVAYNILAISEEGKVYMVYGTESGQGYTLLNTSINDYEVEDVLHYNQTNLCTDESINDCNASYIILQKNGDIITK